LKLRFGRLISRLLVLFVCCTFVALANADDEGNLQPPRKVHPANRPADPVAQETITVARLPAEFERQDALLVAANEFITSFPQLYVDIVAGASRRTQVVSLVTGPQQRHVVERLLADRGLPKQTLQFVEAPHDTMWVRDYGPLFVTMADMSRAIIDADYLQFARPNDDQVPAAVAASFHSNVIHAAIELEGGNLLSNGQGLILTTTEMLMANDDRGRDESAVRQLMREHFGADELVILEPLSGESTGHVDMFAVFTSADTVVVGSYLPEMDPINAELLDRNAARLSEVKLSNGDPLKVERMPMPPHHDNNFRTYTNGIFTNGTLLMPVYPGVDPAGERQAREMFRRLLPGWEIIGIDVTGIIQYGGALHCVSMHVPAPQRPTGEVAGQIIVAPQFAPANDTDRLPRTLLRTTVGRARS
jgi:agmatine/peptidylarginine deiminase